MSRYQSLGLAIDLMMWIVRAVGDSEGKLAATIQDLRDISKDVRYGGQIETDSRYDRIAEALDLCAVTGKACAVCSYEGLMEDGACIRQLKRDAANTIRGQADKIRKLEEQIEAMKAAAEEPAKDELPWEAEEEQ